MTDLHASSDDTERRLVHAGLDPRAVERLVRVALDEDMAGGRDVTSAATIAADHTSTATFGARRGGVIAGLPIAAAVLDVVCGPTARVDHHVADGERVPAGAVLMSVTAPTRALLTAERTALNFLCHLSGVATRTREWADALEGTGARVRDTRKTTPGLRALEKYAVRCGGGTNHRMGLTDMALVKDNHVVGAGGIAAAYRLVRALEASIPVQVEVDSLEGLVEAIGVGASEILIDNFTVAQMTEAVAYRSAHAPHVRLEASGGLTVATARAVAETGVDWIAVGELTHSAPILDIGLDLQRPAG